MTFYHCETNRMTLMNIGWSRQHRWASDGSELKGLIGAIRKGHRSGRTLSKKGDRMVRSPEVDQAVGEAKQLLRDHGYDCNTTAEDLVRWFEADTPFDEGFGLDEVLKDRLILVHELVEIENVKEKGIALTRDVIVKNLENVDDAHMIATEIELSLAASMKDVEHLRDRLENIRMWSEDDTVTPENKEKYRRMHSETLEFLEGLEKRP